VDLETLRNRSPSERLGPELRDVEKHRHEERLEHRPEPGKDPGARENGEDDDRRIDTPQVAHAESGTAERIIKSLLALRTVDFHIP
jgi:hypothetical protein